MRTIPSALQTHIAQQVTSLAECLKITRTDGSVVRLTTHDSSITIDGDIYRAEASYSRSALQSTDTLSVDNAELYFVLDGVYLKKEDFENGLYDQAPFEMVIVNWEDPSDGVIALKKGTLGDITFNSETNVTVQLRGLTQALQKTIVEKYSPTCRVNLGGKKCGIVNVPTRIRRNRQRVKTFDWFLVPTDFTPVTVTNPGFEANGSTVANGNSGITGWFYGATSFWKVEDNFTPGAGTYYLEGGTGDAEEFVLYQDFDLSDLGVTDTDVDAGLYTLDLSGLIASTNASLANTGAVYLEQFDDSGNTLQVQTSDYIQPEYQVWEGIGVAAFMLPGTRHVRIGIRARRIEGSAATVAFDQIVLRYWENDVASFSNRVFRTMRLPARGANEAINMDNPSFESNGAVSNGTSGISGWTFGGGSYWKVGTTFGGLTPQAGSYILGGGNNGSGNPNQVYQLSQTKNIPGSPTSDNLTAGWYYGEASVKVARIDTDSDPRITLEFLNSSNSILATYDSGYDTTSPTGEWYTLRAGGRAPAGSAKMRITLYARGDSAANVVFDDAKMHFIVTAYEHVNDPDYGLLADEEPTYDFDLNDYTVDGAAVVQCRQPHFGFDEVSDVTDKKTFEIVGLSITSTLFYSGKIVWLSGNNAGRTSFIRVWDNTSKVAKLYEKLPYDIQVGDKFVYAPGCDKTLPRCADFFGNTHNMRAEPYLPGQQRVIEFLRGN